MPDISQIIGRFVQLRHAVEILTAKHEAELAPYKTAMTALEGAAHQHLLDNNEQSIKTEHGTVFFKGWTQVKLADKQTFVEWLIDVDDAVEAASRVASFFTAAVSKDAVETYLEENSTLPPGIDIARGQKIHFRKA